VKTFVFFALSQDPLKMEKRKRKNTERAINPEIHVSYPFFGISEKKSLSFFSVKVCMVS
jgi:hypothetical protein